MGQERQDELRSADARIPRKKASIEPSATGMGPPDDNEGGPVEMQVPIHFLVAL